MGERVKQFLLWVGLITRRPNGTIHYPFDAPPRWVWKEVAVRLKQGRNPFLPFLGCGGGRWKPYRFRNLPHVIKWIPGRLLPRRWGFGWLGFEFGDRG